MASWYLIAALQRLRDEFNAIAPNRDKASDGSVGDLAHQENVSDHNPDETGNVPIRDADKENEVHAIDVDVDLRQSGLSMEKVVQFLLERCRSGEEDRLRYIIYNRRIWSASNDWKQKAYTGANPHDHHAHFSGSYETSREASARSWHLRDLIEQEKPAVTAPTASQNADAVAAKDIDPSAGTYSLGGAIWATLARSAYLNQLPGDLAALKSDLDARVEDVDDELDGLGATLAFLSALVAEVTNDPAVPEDGGNIWYTTMRQAVKDELDSRA